MSNPLLPVLRLRNLLALHQAFVAAMVAKGASPSGLEQAFAAHLEISASLWSQFKAGRTISDKVARQIESHCDRPPGWLDAEHAETVPDPQEEKFIALCRDAWAAADKPGRREMRQFVARQMKAAGVVKKADQPFFL